MKWIVLGNQEFSLAVGDILFAAGFELVPKKDGQVPDAVALSLIAGKADILRAGFWRGYGVPVVAVGREYDRKYLALTFGMRLCRDVDEFRQVIASGHPYLAMRPPVRSIDVRSSAIAAAAAGQEASA